MDEIGKIRKNVRSPVVRQWRSLDGCAMGASWNTQDFTTLNSALKNPNSGHAKTEHCDQMQLAELHGLLWRNDTRSGLVLLRCRTPRY